MDNVNRDIRNTIKNHKLCVPIIVLILLSCSRCAIVNRGHSFDRSKISYIKPGEMNRQEVISIFGQPECIVTKHIDGITIFIYKSITNTSVGLPIPVFKLLKTKMTGYQLSIVFDDETDIVISYQLYEFIEKLFWK